MRSFNLNSKRLLTLFLLLMVVAMPVLSVQAQPGELPDADGDTIPDQYDGCPNQAGLPENAGCPEGVAPPDSDGDTLPDVYDGCPTVAGDQSLGGCPDSDGDQVPDNFDACLSEAGFTQNSGCPLEVIADFDGDGIADREDYCFTEAGDALNAGCPPDQSFDEDGDDVPNFSDACYADPGVLENSGCPADIVPDYDTDGVPDAQDQCPRFFGTADNNGCILDSDQDFLEDAYDACPTQPGDGRFNGCPSGADIPDSDADTIPDIFDRCPNEAGTNSLDCPDSDGDNISNIDDTCPDVAGDPALGGCLATLETTLPSQRVPLNVNNASSITFLTQLVTSVSWMDVSVSGTLAIKTWTSGLILYDLTQLTLTPRPLEAVDGQIALSADGRILVDAPYYFEGGTDPALQIWDTATGNGLHFLTIPGETPVNTLAVSPDGSKFATGHGFYSSFGETLPENPNNVRLWDTASGTEITAIGNPAGVIQLAFSPDGTKLAVGSNTGVVILDVASGQSLATIPVPAHFIGKGMAFSPDGSKLAYGQNGGTVTVVDMNTFNVVYTAQVISHETYNTAIAGVSFSPDGSLLAVSGGPFVDGPMMEELDNQVLLLDAATGNPVHIIHDLAFLPGSVKFSGDGTLLIFNNGTSVEFWGISQ
jgi:WD40 repeat protein